MNYNTEITVRCTKSSNGSRQENVHSNLALDQACRKEDTSAGFLADDGHGEWEQDFPKAEAKMQR